MLTKKNKTRNKFEARLDTQLLNSNIKYSYETEKLPYVVKGTYCPDFILYTPKGKIYVEAKGHFRPEHKVKMRAVKLAHPELDIRIVFYSYSLKNSRWAMKYGFPYSIGCIPDDWLL